MICAGMGAAQTALCIGGGWYYPGIAILLIIIIIMQKCTKRECVLANVCCNLLSSQNVCFIAFRGIKLVVKRVRSRQLFVSFEV